MLEDGEWLVVCGVRDPVARAASSLFQIGGGWEAEPDDDAAVAILTQSLIDLFDAGRGRLDWFESQLRPVTGVDVFEEPFDPSAGWTIVDRGRFRVLVIRFEDMPRVAGTALAALFGLPSPLELTHSNDGQAKGYAARYDLFKRTAKLPTRVLDVAYGSQLARHFYAQEELDRFRARWE
jgi:hypothetical protein